MTIQLQAMPKVMAIQEHQVDAAVRFAMKVRREVFPMLNHETLPQDLLHFHEHYMHSDQSKFLVAVTENNEIIGSIGIVPYDGRIEVIKGRYPEGTAAEVVKCYVDAEYRRHGIGSLLAGALKEAMREMAYDTLYLHTHRFLPGAVDFWMRQGFAIVAEQYDEWQTVHMENLQAF